MVIIQGEKRFIKIRTIVFGVIREDFTGVKPVQSKVWGQHFGEACKFFCGFKRIQRASEPQPTVSNCGASLGQV